MIVYRVLHKSVKHLLEGSGNDGRWCSNGRKVIYTSSSVALACLENILRRSGAGFSSNFRTILYDITGIKTAEILANDLGKHWRLREHYPYCQAKGNSWYDKKDTLILKVPSAIIPDEFNYIIRTTAMDIDRITIVENKIFMPDERLENLLISVDTEKLRKLSGGRES